MARKAKSELQKNHIKREKKLNALNEAVNAYKDASASSKVSIRSIALKYGVNKNTLRARLDPTHISIDEFNAKKQTLSRTQEDVLVRWVLEMADRNLALQPHVIREKAQLIAEATKPGTVVHSGWIDRFLSRHQDRLSCHWSRPLDKVRALSSTREAIDSYFNIYKTLVGDNGEKIPPTRQFAYDECGVLRGYNQPVRVVGGHSSTAPKANTSGERELITFVPVISGAGELVTSLVVFPAVHLHPNWVRNNPGGYSVARSANGYMTDVLGEDFIKKFDVATASVASEGPRLLHIDGHSSHVNIPLLDYAVDVNIIVFGYPPHTTHLLQGLDVVLFSPFKHAFAKHAAEHLSVTGRDVDKSDFLKILYQSVQDSFTKDNILTAWRKTGLRPVDRSAIADKDLAASKQFSTTHYAPLEPPSPIKPLIAAIQGQLQLQASHFAAPRPVPEAETPSPPGTPSPLPQKLGYSGAQHLFNDPPTSVDLANSAPALKLSHTSTLLPASLSFPRDQSDIPDAFELVTTKLSAVSLDADPGTAHPTIPPVQRQLSPQELQAMFGAGDALRGLASTSLAGLLEQETITSALKLPPVPQGRIPYDVVKAVEQCKSIPSQELWDATRSSLLTMVPWVEQILAQCVLQQTYCEQLQAKLHSKEKPRAQNAEKKIFGLKGGVIWTDSELMDGLRTNRDIRDGKKEAAQKRSEAKKLKEEAEEWKKSALERQEHAHQVLISQWSANQQGRKPRKPALECIPDIYKDILQPKKRNVRKRKAVGDSEEEDFEEDPNYDEIN